MRIPVDAMGGEQAPDRPAAGALAAIRQAAPLGPSAVAAEREVR